MNSPATHDPTLEPLAPFGVVAQATTPSQSLASLPAETLRDWIGQHRLVVLRGFAPLAEKDDLAEFAGGLGELLEWDFGAVFEVVEHADPKNYLFTSGSVPYHWDGAFASQVPWLQVFRCLESPGAGQGGETLFCDTVRLWQDTPEERRELWRKVEIEYFTVKIAHYGGKIRGPLVGVHPRTGETTLRFAEPANATTVRLNTPELEVHGIPAVEAPAMLEDLVQRLYDPKYAYAHAWETGDYVLADNHALLHGRSPYGSKLPRRLWRVHVL